MSKINDRIAIGAFVFLILGLATVVTIAMMKVVTPDKEPTSHCIDSKFRLFEREGTDSFAVAADPSCN